MDSVPVITLTVEIDREEDGRFIADVRALPGVLAYGKTQAAAIEAAVALAYRVIADRIENHEPIFGTKKISDISPALPLDALASGVCTGSTGIVFSPRRVA